MEVIVLFNTKNQKYEVLGRFHVGGVNYCRVKFALSRHEQIILAEKVGAGDFEDESIVSRPTPVKALVVNPTKKEKEDILTALKALDEVTDATIIEPMPKVQVTTSEFRPLELGLVDTDEFKLTVVATNPKGKELIVAMDELEGFCEKNKLDYDAVIQVIEGHQKTHRKWRFVKGE